MGLWNYIVDNVTIVDGVTIAIALAILFINARNFSLTVGHRLIVSFRYGSLVEWSKPNVMYATPVSPMLIENKKNRPEIITKIFIELDKNNKIELENYGSDPIILEPLKAKILFFEPISYFTKNNEKWKIDDIDIFKKAKIFLEILDKKILAEEKKKNQKYNRKELSLGDYMGLWKDEIPKRKNRPKPNLNIFTPVSIRSATDENFVYSGNIICAVKGLYFKEKIENSKEEVDIFMHDLERTNRFDTPEKWRHTLMPHSFVINIGHKILVDFSNLFFNLLKKYKSLKKKETADEFIAKVQQEIEAKYPNRIAPDGNLLKNEDLFVDSVYTPPHKDQRHIEDYPYIAFEFPRPIKLSRGKKKKG